MSLIPLIGLESLTNPMSKPFLRPLVCSPVNQLTHLQAGIPFLCWHFSSGEKTLQEISSRLEVLQNKLNSYAGGFM